MLSRASAILFFATAGVAPAASPPIDPAKLAHGYDFAAGQLAASAASLTATQYPVVTTATGQWLIRGANDWRAGFFPGQMWRMYEATGATTWRDQAVSRTDPLATAAITQDHDIGFVTVSTWGQAIDLGPTRAYRNAARGNVFANAQILADRFKPALGLIDSWDNLEEPNGVCIDNLMNLELLFAAHAHGGARQFRDIAVAHAQTTLQQFVRGDGSTYHIVRHLEDGAIERKSTRQGYGDETTWSRGQAWAIHGFTTTYQHTRDLAFLTAGERAADYFIANLPHHLDPATNPANAQAGDWVPPSDFHAERGEPTGAWNDADNDGSPGETNAGNRPGTPAGSTPYVNDRLLALNSYTRRDSSAAAVAASGLFRLATLVPDDTPANYALRQKYFDTARNIVGALLTHDNVNPKLNYLADGVSGTGGPLRSILARGSELWNGPDLGTSYGDYYFLEALARYEQAGLDFLPLSVGNQWTGGDGDWSDSSRWTAGAPAGGVGQAAHFRTLAVADTTVMLNVARTVGVMTFNGAGRKYTLVGTGLLRLARGGEALLSVEASPATGHEIAAPLELAGDAASITIAPGAALRISGTLVAAGANRLTKLGDGRLELTGAQHWSAGGIVRVAAGELAIQSNLGAAGPVVRLIADGGQTTLAGPQVLAGLAINAGATVRAAASDAGASPIVTAALDVQPEGTLDLMDNHLVIRGGSSGAWTAATGYGGITGLVAAGRNGGWWDGNGIITSHPEAAPGNGLTGLAVADAAQISGIAITSTTHWTGVVIAGADVLVMYTYAGDANLDGTINIDDYGRIDSNVSKSGSVFGWFNGDFNYDGKINIDDYGIIDGNISRQTGTISTAVGVDGAPALDKSAAVPEPVGLSLFALGSLFARRRRYRPRTGARTGLPRSSQIVAQESTRRALKVDGGGLAAHNTARTFRSTANFVITGQRLRESPTMTVVGLFLFSRFCVGAGHIES